MPIESEDEEKVWLLEVFLFLELTKPAMQLTEISFEFNHRYELFPLSGWGWRGQALASIWEAEEKCCRLGF